MRADERRQFCTFAMGDDLYGIEVQHVQEVLRAQRLTDVPRSPELVLGLMNLRGRIVVVIDLALRLGLRPNQKPARPMNIVLRQSGGSIALLVDRICEVVEVPEDDFEPAPATLSAPMKSLVCGAYKLLPRLLLVLTPELLVDAEGSSTAP